jgi:protein-disulfide isomerase
MNETSSLKSPSSTTTTPAAEETVTFKRSHFFLALLPIAFVLGLAAGYIFWGLKPGGQPETAAVPPAAAPATSAAQAQDSAQDDQQAADQSQQAVKRYDVPEDDDPSIGPAAAPITIIEFSDYQCPYCRKWKTEVYDRLRETYPNEVRIVFRDFPLTSIHPEAQPAAEAANCAGDQGRYWEYHDLLFGMQYDLGLEAYKKYASELGLDVDEFTQCLDDRKYQQEVEADLNYAANLGVRSTPTFFINGIPLVGAQPFEVFQEVITKELAGEIPK